MPIENKSFSEDSFTREAALRRAVDEKHVQFSQAEAEKRASVILDLKSRTPTFPPINPGGLLEAKSISEYLKDSKMQVSILASSVAKLEEEIKSESLKQSALADDLQREAQAISTSILEEEIKTRKNLNKVHFNSFTRQEDSALPYSDKKWLTDPKTGLTFEQSELCNLIQTAGITLPLITKATRFPKQYHLVKEETDMGSSGIPLESSSLIDFANGKPFRHVVLQKDFDETTRAFKSSPCRCTLLIEYTGLEVLNWIEIIPSGSSIFSLEELSYVNEAGETIVLSSIQIPSPTNLSLIFEPVRTKFLKAKFVQTGIVKRGSIESSSKKDKVINELLDGAGFVQKPNFSLEVEEGRVYDFSIRQIVTGISVYRNTGLFRSADLAIRNPISVKVDKFVENISVFNYLDYSSSLLNSNEAFAEGYLGVSLRTFRTGGASYELIPVPDGKATQKELLSLRNEIGSLKLFPDLNWNLVNKIHFSDATWGSYKMYIDVEHGLTRPTGIAQTDELVVVGGRGDDGRIFSCKSINWKVISSTRLEIEPYDVTGYNLYVSNDFKSLPFFYLVEEQSDPLTVWQDNARLDLGEDYLISTDNGVTWLDYWPRDNNWVIINGIPTAGKFKIKILYPNYTSLYSIEYRFLKDQQLSKALGISLKKGKVVFDSKFNSSVGALNTVIILRSNTNNHYLTPIIKSYILEVNEK
jgi:hypothetical protein